MRSNLRNLVLMVSALLITASITLAADFTMGGGVSIETRTDLAGVFARINASHDSRLVGSSFSSSGTLTTMVTHQTMTYQAIADLVGLQKVERVVLTPDSGLTQWPAKQVALTGWVVDLPFGECIAQRPVIEQPRRETRASRRWGERQCAPYDGEPLVRYEEFRYRGLGLGGHCLQWYVWSRDQNNRMWLLVIPINWSSTRRTAMANHIMVQEAPYWFEHLNDKEAFTYLRGFQPAWATQDQAAAMQLGLNQPAPAAPAVTPSPAPVVTPAQPSVQIILCVWFDGERHKSYRFPKEGTESFVAGKTVTIARGTTVIGLAEITVVRKDFIEIRCFKDDNGRYPDVVTNDDLQVVEG